ncbi:MAG TPA: flagellar hook capping FlgD N-terminal domain-containing protein, partial [Acidobacteriaceae bacterium]
TDSATITSSDFLTLLVTELKNQDPTQPTDPNAYIQQLVGVNSLQQLISINQDLTPAPASTSTTGS